MKHLWMAGVVAGFASVGAAAMPGPMMTTNYFPLIDGARYDYVFAGGPHLTASAVMHAGQSWAGATGLTGLHMRRICREGVPCNLDSTEFYRMDPDGMRYFGGNTATAEGAYYMMSLGNPEWLLKSPVTPGTMMGPGMGYQNVDTWQAAVAGMNTMMGPQGYTSSYQAQALETVVTPAGTFTNALHVREQRGSGYQRDVWYAPGVGVVRWMDAQEEAVLEKVTLPMGPVPRVAFAVEYYHAPFDRYFVTADSGEMDALDTGRFSGWQRTGMGFNVIDASDTATPMAASVCRYYGIPTYGLDTHFYSASAEECAAVQRNWPQQWVLESPNVFRVYLPDSASGACPAGTLPVYRSWNRRADTNHRYTTDPAVQMSMMGRGNSAEGYGNPPVAMCSPH